MESFLQKPHAVINIVGRHLILMVFFGPPLPPRHPLQGAYVYVYNWELGTLLMVRVPTSNSFSVKFAHLGDN
jgi:hypothetical protein